MKKATVTNTSREMRREPSAGLGFLGEQMLTGRAIENQEERGQAELVQSDILPTLCSPECIAALEAVGVVFGKPLSNDSLFRNVKLPPGWRKQETEHAMWSDLLDDKGRKRASIFYKAAFYDRRASMTACRRFGIDTEYGKKDGKRDYETSRAAVTDGGTVVFQTEWRTVPHSEVRNGLKAAEDMAREEACAWLDERRSEWKNAAAYWDVP